MATYMKLTANQYFRKFCAVLTPAFQKQVLQTLEQNKNKCNTNLKKIFPSQRFRGSQAAGVGSIGPTWAFLGLFKKKEEKPLTEMDQIKEMVIGGIKAKDKGDLKEASDAFHKALMKSQEFLKDEKITQSQHLHHRVFIYDQLANLNLEVGNLKEAENLFKETMKLALQLGMAEDHNAMMEMSLKLATIYLYSGRHELGVIGLRHCIEVQEKKLKQWTEEGKDGPKNGNNSSSTADDEPEYTEEEKAEMIVNTKVLLGKSYRHYANYHMQQRKFKEAKTLMCKALDIAKSVLGPEHDQIFVIMNDLATLQIMLQEYDEAEQTLLEGLKLSKKTGSLMQSALYSNLGALYIRKRMFFEAKDACETGLKIAEKSNDEFLKLPCKMCLEKLSTLFDKGKLKEGNDDDDDDDVPVPVEKKK